MSTRWIFKTKYISGWQARTSEEKEFYRGLIKHNRTLIVHNRLKWVKIIVIHLIENVIAFNESEVLLYSSIPPQLGCPFFSLNPVHAHIGLLPPLRLYVVTVCRAEMAMGVVSQPSLFEHTVSCMSSTTLPRHWYLYSRRKWYFYFSLLPFLNNTWLIYLLAFRLA
jgi:hypothetical protein